VSQALHACSCIQSTSVHHTIKCDHMRPQGHILNYRPSRADEIEGPPKKLNLHQNCTKKAIAPMEEGVDQLYLEAKMQHSKLKSYHIIAPRRCAVECALSSSGVTSPMSLRPGQLERFCWMSHVELPIHCVVFTVPGNFFVVPHFLTVISTGCVE